MRRVPLLLILCPIPVFSERSPPSQSAAYRSGVLFCVTHLFSAARFPAERFILRSAKQRTYLRRVSLITIVPKAPAHRLSKRCISQRGTFSVARFPARRFILRSAKQRTYLRRVSLITIVPKAPVHRLSKRCISQRGAFSVTRFPARRSYCPHKAPITRATSIHVAPSAMSSTVSNQPARIAPSTLFAPNPRKSAFFSRMAALNRELAPLQAAAPHGKTHRTKPVIPFRHMSVYLRFSI